VSSVILGAARTPIGAFLGGLAPIAAKARRDPIKCALERAGVKPDQVDEVFMGNVVQGWRRSAPARQPLSRRASRTGAVHHDQQSLRSV